MQNESKIILLNDDQKKELQGYAKDLFEAVCSKIIDKAITLCGTESERNVLMVASYAVSKVCLYSAMNTIGLATQAGLKKQHREELADELMKMISKHVDTISKVDAPDFEKHAGEMRSYTVSKHQKTEH